MDIYTSTIRPLLFSGIKLDPEKAHNSAMTLLKWLEKSPETPPQSWLLNFAESNFCLQDNRLKQTLWGLEFANPLGIAAGFDKDGVAARIWDRFGFGYAELGTVTYHSQPGNLPPRLFRLLPDEAILNRMGFNNQGSVALQKHLESRKQGISIPIGINLGKSKITPLDQAATDYLGSFRRLKALGDYFVVNVSSPNTPGLRTLQSSDQLKLILEALQQENQGKKPITVKIAPDLSDEAILAVLELAKTYQVAGIIATNTTIRRDQLQTQVIEKTGKPVTEEAGGISGQPLKKRSTEVIRLIWRETGGQLPIIGVGGIFTAADAWEKITAGACLLQVYTGLVYEGPGMVKRILTGLLERLEESGFASLQEAVGQSAINN
ncbi:quinone-dependent dihydroorotate dehydrogenase [Spirulina sp. CS-785/01]|uniref:quinone-dependent dihydroorotate dehydrogenase n=1 Tax=Spirulina sp. CS-785/01 TaxID=3021716 RepID=UPI00232F52DB|nr:quinone-dependent dihydroorotate dehydrogenase [Spirulina sp. CS-785/01]MDB9315081.1 quinone-dependent dihydroorotate dehydrogenase [Spirulina sp. CS-785/01]